MTDIEYDSKFPNVSGKRRKMAEMLVDPDCDMSVSAMCKELNVSRNTFYRWQKEPSFRGYVNYLIDSYTDSELANVWKALIKKAIGGDTNAQKLFFELKNLYKQTVDLKGGVVFIGGEDEIKD